MAEIWVAMTSYLSRFDFWRTLIDIIIVAVLIYYVLKWTRGTRAIEVLKGLAVLLVASMLSELLHLTAFTWITQYVLNNGAILLVVLFQPELRKAFEQLGRGEMLKKTGLIGDVHVEGSAWVTDELVNGLVSMSRAKTGALILIEQKTRLDDYMASGTRIDGLVSAALLINIFEPDTPLHDAAVVLRGNRIAAAGCVLPLSENTHISKELGTRHRAALGISEQTDALVLVVSEETGIISMAQKGQLTRHLDPTGLRSVLQPIYGEEQENASPLDKLKIWRKRNHG